MKYFANPRVDVDFFLPPGGLRWLNTFYKLNDQLLLNISDVG